MCVFISDADHESVLFSELPDIWLRSEPKRLGWGVGDVWCGEKKVRERDRGERSRGTPLNCTD